MGPRARAFARLKKPAMRRSTRAARKAGRLGQRPFVAYARSVVEAEALAVRGLLPRIGDAFAEAVQLVLDCRGRVVVTGMGKAGFIAQKLSAIFASTGTSSLYLHPAEALHGDLGRVTRDDVVLALSNSGATDEILRIISPLRRIGAKVVALTGDVHSPLATAAHLVLDIGRIDEACPMGLVPTASTAALHALGDALAMTVLKSRPITDEEYALYHPGGKLGRSVMKVSELMRAGPSNPVVRASASLAQAVAVMTDTPGRPGATSVVDEQGRLVGIFTDGDLRRVIERGQNDFSVTVRSVMGKKPRTVSPDERVLEAAELMRKHQIDQIPVVDGGRRPVGLLDVQDLLSARVL